MSPERSDEARLDSQYEEIEVEETICLNQA